MPLRQINHAAARVLVQAGFLVRSIMHRHHLHMIILEVELVVARLDLGRVLSPTQPSDCRYDEATIRSCGA